MNSAITKCVVAAALVVAYAVPVLADAPHDINWRRHHQQERIHQGMHSGQMTHREARNIEGREHRFHQSEMRDRRHDHGHLTNRERWNLSRRQNRMSHSIYRDKHNNHHQ